MNRHYGFAAVSRSLHHFVLGKSFAAIATIAVLLLLARLMEPAEYAVYVALQALALLIGRVASVGVEKVMLRYLPELRAGDDHAAAYRLLWQGTLLRLLSVALLSGLIWLALPLIAAQFGFAGWLWLAPWYLLVGLLRLMNQWLVGMLECFLWQRITQYSMAGAGVVKLLLVVLLAHRIDLPLVVAIELAVEGFALALLTAGWLLRWRRDPERHHGSRRWWRENRARVLRYGLWGLAQNLSRLPYGSPPNRLLVAHYLPAPEVALYGLADNLINNIVRRFMPTKLFMGLIRPVAIARFSVDQDFARVAFMSSLAYRINLLLLALATAVVVAAGEPLFDWLTDGKYGAAAWLVAGMLLLMATEGMRNLVELMTQAVEQNQLFFWSNLIQSASLLLAIPLIPLIGVWSVVVANIAGTAVANLLAIWRLRRAGYPFRLDPAPIALIVLYGTLAAALGRWLAQQWQPMPLITAALVSIAFGLLCLLRPPFDQEERRLFRRLRPGRGGRRRAAAAGSEVE